MRDVGAMVRWVDLKSNNHPSRAIDEACMLIEVLEEHHMRSFFEDESGGHEQIFEQPLHLSVIGSEEFARASRQRGELIQVVLFRHRVVREELCGQRELRRRCDRVAQESHRELGQSRPPHLVEQRYERAVGLSEDLAEQHSVLSGAIPARSFEEELEPVALQPYGRELEEVAREDELNTSKALRWGPQHDPADRVQLLEETTIEHRHLIDHQHSRPTPPLRRVTVQLHDELIGGALTHAYAGKRVESRTADDRRGDAGGGGHLDRLNAPFLLERSNDAVEGERLARASPSSEKDVLAGEREIECALLLSVELHLLFRLLFHTGGRRPADLGLCNHAHIFLRLFDLGHCELGLELCCGRLVQIHSFRKQLRVALSPCSLATACNFVRVLRASRLSFWSHSQRGDDDVFFVIIRLGINVDDLAAVSRRARPRRRAACAVPLGRSLHVEAHGSAAEGGVQPNCATWQRSAPLHRRAYRRIACPPCAPHTWDGTCGQAPWRRGCCCCCCWE